MTSKSIMSDEHREAISSALKEHWSDPDYRARTVAAQTAGVISAWSDESKKAKRLEKLRATLAAKKAQKEIDNGKA